VTALVSGILDDAHKLLRQQIDMLKVELHEDFRRSKRAAEYGGVGVALIAVGVLGLVTALALFLHEQFHFSLWASFTITGGFFFVLGLALAVAGYLLLERFNPLPDKTFHAIQENLSWQTK
jgi:uncharacterized membrane protein YqjE